MKTESRLLHPGESGGVRVPDSAALAPAVKEASIHRFRLSRRVSTSHPDVVDDLK